MIGAIIAIVHQEQLPEIIGGMLLTGIVIGIAAIFPTFRRGANDAR